MRPHAPRRHVARHPTESPPAGVAATQSSRQRPGIAFTPDSPLITDIEHPAIQIIRQLRKPSVRAETGCYYVEGLRFVAQAARHDAALEAVVICPRLLTHPYTQRLVGRQRARGVPVLTVTPRVMHQIAHVEDTQGIGAVVRQRWERLAAIVPGDELGWIALDTVRNPGNLGTILRTSEAVGGAGLIVLGNGVDPYDPTVVRATMGALYRQRLVRATLADFATWRARHQPHVVGTAPDAATDYHEFAYRRPTILMMGGERRGLPAVLRALCDDVVRIPMVGDGDSLNLGVATGVLLYELFNQRRMWAGQ